MTSRKNLKDSDIPFYAVDPNRRTSIEIIREAKEELKSMATKRPSTPFSKCITTVNSRPSSSSSQLSSESPKSRPLSGVRLQPICPQRIPHLKPEENLSLEPIVTKTPLLERKHENSVTVSKGKLLLQGSQPKVQEEHDQENNELIGDCLEFAQNSDPLHSNVKEIDLTDMDESKAENFAKNISEILPSLEELLKPDHEDENYGIDTIEKLHQLFKASNMFKASFRNRFRLLKMLFKLLDVHRPKLSFGVVHLILNIGISGKNLETVCKFLRKLCRDEKNASEFATSVILEPFFTSMRDVSVQYNIQTLKYYASLMYNISANEELVDYLAALDCHSILLSHLSAFNSLESCERNKEHSSIVTEIILALKNLSVSYVVWEWILRSSVLDVLFNTLVVFQKDLEVVLAAVRFLSEIAVDPDGSEVLISSQNTCSILVELIKSYRSHQLIILQIMSIIGILTSINSDFSLTLCAVSGFLNSLLFLLDSCTEKMFGKAKRKESFSRNSIYISMYDKIPKKDIEFVSKVSQVLANLCLNPSTGSSLANDEKCITSLLQITALFKNENAGHFVSFFCEPLSCVLVALANIAYFISDQSETSALSIKIVEDVIPFLTEPYSSEVNATACNIIMNLTRMPSTSSFVIENELVPVFVELLHARENVVVIRGYRIMMNLLLDKRTREPFCKNEGVTTLLHKLLNCLGRDWELAGLLCQVLWNYCGTEVAQEKPLVPMVIDFLIRLFRYATGKSAVLSVDSENVKLAWEIEFLPQAKKLQALIESWEK